MGVEFTASPMARSRNEGSNLAKEFSEGRLIAEENMVGAVEVDEMRACYAGRQRLALRERNRGIVPGMKHQSRHADLVQKV
jgi:hypothetical protein